jgi:DNA gyrase subunit A
MRLPLRGLEEFVKRAGRPEEEINEAATRGEYFLSERQAQAILDMRLSKLTGLEQEKLAGEYASLCETIARLQAILASEARLKAVIVGELVEIRDRFGDARRTEILPEEGDLEIEDLIAVEDMIVTCSHVGYIKRMPVSEHRAQRRGGKGKAGMETREEDWVNQIFVASTHSYVLFFSDKGKAYLKKVFEIPAASRTSKGRAIVNFVGMEPGEKVAAIVPVLEFAEGRYLMTATRKGSVKKTDLMAYSNIRQNGIIGVGIDDGDELIAALVTDGTCDVLIGTRKGMALRFSEEEVRPMGRGAAGVRGIELRENDEVVGMSVVESGRGSVLTVCQNGYGKRTDLEEYRIQHRGGIGLISIQASERNGDCVALRLLGDTDDLLFVTDKGTLLRTKANEISIIGRNTQGVRLVKTDESEKVVGVEVVQESVVPAETETLVLDGAGGGEGFEGAGGAEVEDEGEGGGIDEGDGGPEDEPAES